MDSLAQTRKAWLLFIVLGVLAVDQATKYAVEQIISRDFIHVLIPGLLNLVNTHNSGVAFGFLADSKLPWVATVVMFFSASVMIFLIWLLASNRAGGRLGQIGLSLILGGAAGNMLDRLVHRSVTDFIDIHWQGYYWPAFNAADSAIVLGACLVLLELLRDWRHATREAGKEPS
jgi:signal peptidase II